MCASSTFFVWTPNLGRRRLNGCAMGIVFYGNYCGEAPSGRELHMTESEEAESGEDLVVAALAALSDVAASTADDLISLNENLAALRNDRVRGRSWHRIISDVDPPNPLPSLTTIATNFARASGAFRRALAVGLRKEGMQVTEIAALFGVSRQRVSALIRPRPQGENEQLVD
jgi:hypothetical protein